MADRERLPVWLLNACTSLGVKYCWPCNTLKPHSEFSLSGRTRDGLLARCKKCDKAYWNSYREKTSTPEKKVKTRAYYLKKNYGLPQEEAEKIANNIFGVCECCGHIGNRDLDHDHVTGKVRVRRS